MTLDSIYHHWSRGDWTPRFALYDEEMEWGWSDEFPGIAGVRHDTETPNPRLNSWLRVWDTWRCEVEEYIEYGDVIVALCRYYGRGKGSGVEVEQEGAHVWTLRDGRVVRLEVFASRERALREAQRLASALS